MRPEMLLRDVGYVANIINEFPVLLWLSLPCAGGTSWSHVNLKFPSAAKKVMRHVKLMKKLWKAIEQFIELMLRSLDIAIGWPQNCPYWRLPRVVRFMNEHSLQPYSFHGCMLGVVDQEALDCCNINA